MTYYNADGGEADMCGNGARCTVAYAHERGLLGTEGFLLTRPGKLAARVHGPADVEVALPGLPRPPPGPGPRNARLGVAQHHHCNTGVPHLVIPVDDVEAVPVAEPWPALRHAPPFAPGRHQRQLDRAQSRARRVAHPHLRARRRGRDPGLRHRRLGLRPWCSADWAMAASPVASPHPRRRSSDHQHRPRHRWPAPARTGPVVAYSGEVEIDD